MGILCKLFGHKLGVGHSKGHEYATLEGHYTDSIGRVHVHVYAECSRCSRKFKVANAHIHYDLSLEEMIKSFHEYYMRLAITTALNNLPDPEEVAEVEEVAEIPAQKEIVEQPPEVEVVAAPKKRGRKKKVA